jgi:hypothetical protein
LRSLAGTYSSQAGGNHFVQITAFYISILGPSIMSIVMAMIALAIIISVFIWP